MHEMGIVLHLAKTLDETVLYGKTCPFCGSEETWLVRGNECIIKEIEAEDADDNNT